MVATIFCAVVAGKFAGDALIPRVGAESASLWAVVIYLLVVAYMLHELAHVHKEMV
jgi:hypothetical protein